MPIPPGDDLSLFDRPSRAVYKRPREAYVSGSQLSELDPDDYAPPLAPSSSRPSRAFRFPSPRDRPRLLRSRPVQPLPAPAGDPLLEGPEPDDAPPSKRIRVFRTAPRTLVPPSRSQALLLPPSSQPALSRSSGSFNVPVRRGLASRVSYQAYRPGQRTMNSYASPGTGIDIFFDRTPIRPLGHTNSIYRLPARSSWSTPERRQYLPIPYLTSTNLRPFIGFGPMLTSSLAHNVRYMAHFLLHLYADSAKSGVFRYFPSLPSLFRRLQYTASPSAQYQHLIAAIDEISRLRNHLGLLPPKFQPVASVANAILPFPRVHDTGYTY